MRGAAVAANLHLRTLGALVVRAPRRGVAGPQGLLRWSWGRVPEGGVVTPEEYAKLLERCRALPTGRDYRETDYVSNLLITVLDFQAKVPGVNKAIDYYEK